MVIKALGILDFLFKTEFRNIENRLNRKEKSENIDPSNTGYKFLGAAAPL